MTRSVLVTGAAGGIGVALVQGLNHAGWQVIGSDHPSAKPSRACKSSVSTWIPQDLESLVADEAAQEAFARNVAQASAQSPLQAVIHNAALQRLGDFAKLSNADWQSTLAVNLLAPVAISRILLPQLIAQSGSIVHISSIHGQLTKPGFTAYATSKAALTGLTRAMAVELGNQVRVNAIELAAIATTMLEAGFAESPQKLAALQTYHPTGCIGSTHDVSRAVLFLLNPANTFLNGCVLPLGGGIHSRLHDPS